MPSLPIVAFDLVAIVVLSYGLYFRRHGRRDMPLAFVGLNVGVMALAAVLATVSVGTGLGLGLFGVLSLIRLRSSEIAQEEVAYYFIALALGLLAGFEPDPQWVAPALGSMLVGVMFLADHPQLYRRHRRQVVRLDAAYADEAELRGRLAELLGAEVTHMVVLELDLVRDTTEVDVRYRLRAGDVAPGGPAQDSHQARSVGLARPSEGRR